MTTSPATRYSLLIRIQDAQNHAAWMEFVALYEPLVYRLARRKGLQDADARDLCQDVFRAVAGAVRRWTPDPKLGSFRGWLFRIAKNSVANYLRHGRRHERASGHSDVQRMLELQPATDECSQAVETEHRRRLFEVAARKVESEVSRPTWQAFWETAVLSREAGEVAKGLRMTLGAVYIARSRVMARLRERIAEMEGEEK
jgi:RNA polymerase sigma factor (sigma-70 family)